VICVIVILVWLIVFDLSNQLFEQVSAALLWLANILSPQSLQNLLNLVQCQQIGLRVLERIKQQIRFQLVTSPASNDDV
jgi:hypothetical protein